MDGGSDEREGKGTQRETKTGLNAPCVASIYLSMGCGRIAAYNLEAKTNNRPSVESCQKLLGA